MGKKRQKATFVAGSSAGYVCGAKLHAFRRQYVMITIVRIVPGGAIAARIEQIGAEGDGMRKLGWQLSSAVCDTYLSIFL